MAAYLTSHLSQFTGTAATMNGLIPAYGFGTPNRLLPPFTALLLILSTTLLALYPNQQAFSAEKDRAPNVALIFIDDK